MTGGEFRDSLVGVRGPGPARQLVELGTWTYIRWALWLLVGFFGVFPGIVAYMVWLERKVAARFQDRIGPNRVGPLGLLQPIADAIKLITKEDLVPRNADQIVHLAAPVLVIVSAFLVMAVIPFAINMAPVNLPSGMVYLIAVSSISPLGIFLAGWSSRNKYSLLGAMRSVAQLVSYEVPQVLSTIPIVLWTGSLSLVTRLRQAARVRLVDLLAAGPAGVCHPVDRQHRRGQPHAVRPARSRVGDHRRLSHRVFRHAVRPVLPGRISERVRRQLPGDGLVPGGRHADPVRGISHQSCSARQRFSYVLVDLILIPVFLGKGARASSS